MRMLRLMNILSPHNYFSLLPLLQYQLKNNFKMKLLVSVALLVSSAALLVEGFSGGAPSQACDTLSPNPTQHGAQPQNTAVPYEVDLSAFDDGNSGRKYTLGATYALSISGMSGEQFRGFFVQARQMSNDANRVGTFTVTDALSRLSSCSPATDGITHISSVDKSTISFNWTAPMEETGAIRFGFAVVQVQATYWANERAAVIQQVGGAAAVSNFGICTVLAVAILTTFKLM